MSAVRLLLRILALIIILSIAAYLFACVAGNAQTNDLRTFKPDTQRALASRTIDLPSLEHAQQLRHTPQRDKSQFKTRALTRINSGAPRPPAHPARRDLKPLEPLPSSTGELSLALISTRIAPNTPLARVLHTSQLSITSSAGTNEQYVDRNGDLIADERATFDTSGGAFDIAVGRTGTRYEVYSAIDDRGTSNPNDDISIGVLVTAFDTNGDYTRDSANVYDLHRDFNLPSAIAVVSGTSRAGCEFVVVSSSGYFNASNPNDPNNEPTAGVVLLVRDAATGGFDNTRSRTLVQVGNNQLNNANALALLPNNDLLIADFDSDELRIVRDTDNDGMPDTLDATPYYSYRFSNDAPLDIAANSRGVVFSHSFGNNAPLLALYDTDGNGRADTDTVVAEGLSLDNNLYFHGLTVDREGTVYVIEDASGAADTVASGGNGGTPLIDAFPDPALNGFLRDGALYVTADNPTAQALSGLAFGVDAVLGAVRHLSLVNSASLSAPATKDGLATISGTNLTLGRTGASASDAVSRGLRVTIEGRAVPVHSFDDRQVNIYVPKETGTGMRSVVVSVDGNVVAAEDVSIANDNPALFTANNTGAGEAVALLVSGLRYTVGPFPATFNDQPSVVALFGTGWRNSLPVNVSIGGQSATVEYAGAAGGFAGLDQINVRVPVGARGSLPLIVKTANGATSRSDVVIGVN